jgi:hypothetical protein
MVSSGEDDTSQFGDIPVFVPWKTNGTLQINWPATQSENINVKPDDQTAWVDKSSYAFFSGRVHDHDNPFPSARNKRSQLQRLFETDPQSKELMNISVAVGDDKWDHHHFYTWVEEAKFKYQLEIDGAGAPGSYLDHLSMNSLVFKELSSFYQWFEPALEAYRHFVPVDLTDLADSVDPGHDLKSKISWARKHDDTAKEIAERGTDFLRHHLNHHAVRCYMAELLFHYQELMQFDDQLPPQFASSPDLCKLLEVDKDSERCP